MKMGVQFESRLCSGPLTCGVQMAPMVSPKESPQHHALSGKDLSDQGET